MDASGICLHILAYHSAVETIPSKYSVNGRASVSEASNKQTRSIFQSVRGVDREQSSVVVQLTDVERVRSRDDSTGQSVFYGSHIPADHAKVAAAIANIWRHACVEHLARREVTMHWCWSHDSWRK